MESEPEQSPSEKRTLELAWTFIYRLKLQKRKKPLHPNPAPNAYYQIRASDCMRAWYDYVALMWDKPWYKNMIKPYPDFHTYVYPSMREIGFRVLRHTHGHGNLLIIPADAYRDIHRQYYEFDVETLRQKLDEDLKDQEKLQKADNSEDSEEEEEEEKDEETK